jgi:predicted transcriptional regulator
MDNVRKTMKKEVSNSGPRVIRSSTVSVRLDSDLEYLARIAARLQRRTLSSYVEWAVEQSLKDVVLSTHWREAEWEDDTNQLPSQNKRAQSLAELGTSLCSGDEVDRFMNIAVVYPNVLDEEQKRLYQLIQSDASFRTKSKPVVIEGIKYDSYKFDRNAIRARWSELKEEAKKDSK